jgi:hypothetical protein
MVKGIIQLIISYLIGDFHVELKIRSDIRYPASPGIRPDIRYQAFRLAGFPAKSVSGA